jgi:hypothetical protein
MGFHFLHASRNEAARRGGRRRRRRRRRCEEIGYTRE